MTNEQRKAVEDLKAYLEFALAEDVPFYSVLGTVGHDIRGLFDEDATFLPRTSGYSERVKELV